MSNSRRGNYTNTQARVRGFNVGDRVYTLLSGNPSYSGTVVAVWPAIGMVDVQFPHGSARHSVDELVIYRSADFDSIVDLQSATTPGGVGTVSVPGGPQVDYLKTASRVVDRFLASKKRG